MAGLKHHNCIISGDVQHNNPSFHISLCISPACFHSDSPIIPTVDPITFLRGSSDILTAKVAMLISYCCQQRGSVTRKRWRVQDKMQSGKRKDNKQDYFCSHSLCAWLSRWDREKSIKKAWSQNIYKTGVEWKPRVRTTFSHQDTFDVDMHETIENKLGQFPWLIGPIASSAKAEVNILASTICDEDTCPQQLDALCTGHRITRAWADTKPSISRLPFTSMPIEY